MQPERNIVLYDGTFDGMLTAVAYVVKGNHQPAGIYDRSRHMPKLFEQLTPTIYIPTDHNQAKRLFLFLQKTGHIAARYAINIYLSEEVHGAEYLVGMVTKILHNGSTILDCYTDTTIRHIDGVSRKVQGEAHRLNGLIRFRKLKGAFLYAPIEPDYNVLGYCAQHFMARLGNMKWILHDLKRDMAIFWDTKKIQPVQMDDDFAKHIDKDGMISEEWIDEEEGTYQELWRIFHTSIANKKRQNKNLQKQYMPKRYWKYLIEDC